MRSAVRSTRELANAMREVLPVLFLPMLASVVVAVLFAVLMVDVGDAEFDGICTGALKKPGDAMPSKICDGHV